MHVLSYHHEPEYNKFRLRGLYEDGLKFWDEADDNSMYQESPMFDEIMNEFYTIKMMETEGIYNSNDYIIKSKTLLDQSSEKVKYHGNGYIKSVQLSELYDKLFGNELLKAKLYNRQEFANKFNEKYKDIDIKISEGEGIPIFEKIGTQIATDLYGAYGTAINIWKINKKNQVIDEGFNFYKYLKDTKDLINYLPQKEDTMVFRTDKSNMGLPDAIFQKIAQMDYEFICEYIKPDIMEIEDKDMQIREINTLSSVINILRENIQDLDEHDIDSLSYGKIKEYTHSGRDCLIINTEHQDFMTFVNNSIEQNSQFSAYSKFKRMTEYKKLEFTEESENNIRKALADKGYEVQEFKYATVYDAGRYGMYSLIKADNSYYTATGEIKKVKLSDIRTLENQAQQKFEESMLIFDLYKLSSETTISSFNKISQNIRNIERTNEQEHFLEDERSR